MNEPQQPRLETLTYTAWRAAVTRWSIHQAVLRGELRSIRLGGRTYFDSREVDAWIERRIADGRKRANDRQKFVELAKRSVAARKAKRETAATSEAT